MSRILAIDPGVNTGWAVLQGEELEASGVVKAQKAGTSDRISQFCLLLIGSIEPDLIEIDAIVYEDYASFDKSHGRPEQSAHVNGLFTGIAVGATIEHLYSEGYSMPEIHAVNPMTWKGKTPKAVTEKRVRAHFKIDRAMTEHEADAIALGWWFARQKSWEATVAEGEA